MDQAITFVCCIEFGRLESQTILMISTLRANAGRLSKSRVIVVSPRMGPSLSAGTMDTLRDLGAELVSARRENPAPWYNFSNKIAAINIAEKMSTTPLVAWLDSDVLISAEPTDLLLESDVDFAARGEYLVPAVYEGVSEHVPYWESMCSLAGLRITDLPFIDYDHPDVRFRCYFNAGIYVWRRGKNFPQTYLRLFKAGLDSRAVVHDGNVFMTDQVLLSVVVMKLKFRWKHLTFKENHMTFPGQIEGVSKSPPMTGSSLIHYSASLNAPHRDSFIRRLEVEVPHLLPAVQGSLRPRSATLVQRAMEIWFRGIRKTRLRAFAKAAIPAPKG